MANQPSATVIDYLLDDGTEERLKDLFNFYDEDGNGMIQREELLNVLTLCVNEIGLEVDAYLELIVDAVFSNANLTECGSITFEALKEVLKQRPKLSNELSLVKGNNISSTSNVTSTTSGRYLANNSLTSSATGATRTGDSTTTPQRFIQSAAVCWDTVACFLGGYIPICNKLRWEYIINNLVRFNFFLAIAFISTVLYIARIVTYWPYCGWLIIARASGQCLNFFCSIIVLLVCRRSISYLRSIGYGRYLPLDDHIYFHRMIGMFICVHSLLHTIGHLFNFMLRSREPDAKFTWAEYLFTVNPQIGWAGHCASITGWFLLIIMVIMSSAQRFSRKLGKFELFYYTHLLYIPFWILLIIHAPNFWAWFLGPCAVFIVEALIRLRNLLLNFASTDQTTIIKAVPLPSNVIHLVIKKPPNFVYNPGDWVYVLVPQIAKYEWHPFTISSAPEQDGVIWLHIRAVGEWTRSLKSFFEGLEDRNHLRKFIKSGQFSISMEQFSTLDPDSNYPNSALNDIGTSSSTRNNQKLGQLRANHSKSLAPIPENQSMETIKSAQVYSCDSNMSCQTECTNLNSSSNSNNNDSTISISSSGNDISQTSGMTARKPTKQRPNITIFIDGPYGSPSSQIFRAEHAVLIATGIGVTPFASILQSLVMHYEKRRQKCPNCLHEFSDPRPPFEFKLRKVDFVWINRDQKSFEWFIKLMAELELTQSQLPPNERFLDIHIHLTAMTPGQIKSVGLQLALYLVHEKNKKDLVTGLKTRTKVGRPDWDEFFTNIQEQKKGKVSVFFCGRPQLGRRLHRQCDSFGFKFRKEIF